MRSERALSRNGQRGKTLAQSGGERSDLSSTSGPTLLSEALLRLLPIPMLVALLLRPFGVSDLGWQIKLGELIEKNGGPYIQEGFASTHLGEHLTPNAWLAQVVYAYVNTNWGFTGLRAIDALAWLAGLLVVAIASRLRNNGSLSTLLALIVAFTVALPSASIRPQSFASLAFGLTLVLMRSNWRWPSVLIAGLPLFVLWQNFHPSVSIAALILGVVAAWRWARHFAKKEGRPVNETILAVLAGAAVFATPAGTAIVELAHYNAQASLLMRATEWLPLWYPVNRDFLWSALLSAALTAAVAVRHRDRMSVEDIAPAVVTFFMTLFAARFILFYAIALIPVISKAGLSARKGQKPARNIFHALSIVASVVSLVALYTMPIIPEKDIPTGQIRKLLSLTAAGTVFCDPAYGGEFIFDGYPDWRVAFDGRLYLYSKAEWSMFNRTSSNQPQLAELDRIYRPVAFALTRARSAGLIEELQIHGGEWREVYADDASVFFVKAGDRPRRAITPQ